MVTVDNISSTPAFGAGHDYVEAIAATINPANGSLSMRISAPVPKERGLNLPLNVYLYDSTGHYQWQPYTRTYSTQLVIGGYTPTTFPTEGSGNVLTAGNRNVAQVSNSAPVGSMGSFTAQLYEGQSDLDCQYTTGYNYTDNSGGRHALPLFYETPGSTTVEACNHFHISSSYGTSGADDSYFAMVDPLRPYSAYISDLHGTQLNPTYKVEDTNGNYLNGTGRSYKQTASSLTVPGLTAPYTLSYAPYSGPVPSSPFSPNAVVIGDANGGASCPTSLPSPISGPGRSGTTVVTLPNNQTYKMTFDPNYDQINGITYPTGATVSYTWGNNPQSDVLAYTASFKGAYCIYKLDMPAVQQDVISYDGTHPAIQHNYTYSTTWSGTSWASKTTTIKTTDLVLNTAPTTVTYTYLPAYPEVSDGGFQYEASPIPQEHTITYKDASGNVLKTITKTWSNINLLSGECTTLDTGQTSGVFYQYQTYPTAIQATTNPNLVTDKAEYDYGMVSSSCVRPSSTPTRETTTSYHSFPMTPINTYILDRPDTVTVTDNGITVEKTTYAYDEYAVASVSSALAHDETNYGSTSTAARGNLTTLTRHCLQTGCPDSVVHYHYDETGQVVSFTDANSNITSYIYADNYASAFGSPSGNTNTYLKSVTYPSTNGVVHAESFQYDWPTGQVRIHTDQNGNMTSYCYEVPGCLGTRDIWGRLTEIDSPDGGKSTASYSDAGPNPSTTLSQLLSGSTSIIHSTTFDAYGHAITSQLVSDPVSPVIVDTAYNGLGQVLSRSNPYRKNTEPTYGLTTFTYDALGRVLYQCQPDNRTGSGPCVPGNSYLQMTYAGNTTTSRDEVGNQWQRTTDALGRLVKVVEPGSLTTSYTYDALNNLKCADQWGAGTVGAPCGSARKRSFSFDSLSRLTSSYNPETGTLSYAYLTSTNALCAGDVSLPCSKTDARGIRTAYTYDTLNRLTNKQSVGGAGVSAFNYLYGYDVVTPATANGIGRLLYTTTSPGSASGISEQYSYDSMGRMITDAVYLPSAGSTPATVLASYDFAGNMINLVYPDGRVVTNSIDSADRMNAVTYAKWNGTSINQPYLTSTNAYDPDGHLTYAIYGNGTQYYATYDNRERVNKLTYGPPGPLWSKQYAWAANNNLQSETNLVTGVQRQYNYDTLNRLTAAQDIYSNLAVASSANGNTSSTSSSGSGAEETPGGTGAIPVWTNPDDSNVLPNFGEPNSNWQGTGVTPYNVAAPDGTMTATTLLSTSSSSGIIMGGFVPDPSIYAGETMGGSVWLRATTPTAMNVYLIGAGTANGGIVASTQAQLTTSWQQVQVRGLVQGTPTALSLQIGGGAPAVTGQNIYMWNPMVEDEGIAGTSVTNYLPYSQMPTGASWLTLDASVAINTGTAPDATNTAATITTTAGTNDTWIIDQVANPAPYAQQEITGSLFVKSANSFSTNLEIVESYNGTYTICRQLTISVTTVWQRFSVTCQAQNALSRLYLQVTGGGLVNGQSIQLWGAQMELASTVGPYVATDSIPASKATSLTNLLPYSEEMQYPGWQAAQNTISSTNATAPDGSLTATQISAPASGGNILMSDQALTPELADGLPVTGSIYLKWISGPTTATVGLYTVSNAGSQYLGTTTVTLSSTWQRFQVRPPNGGTLPSGLTSVGLVFGGTAGQTYQAWGAQLELASHAGPYIATSATPIITGSQPTNVLPNSQSLNGPNWSVVAGSVTVNSDTAPDGTQTAATLNGQSWGSSNQYTAYLIANVPNPSLYDGQTVTASVYLRSPSASGAGATTQMYIVQSGTSGSLLNNGKNITLSSQWQRYSITATLQNGLTNVYFQFGSAATGQTLEAWGAQFVIGTDPDAYTPTPSTTTVYATGTPGTLVQTGLNQVYAYDSFGNILQNGSFQSSYTANNQMSGYAYDASGNLLSDGMNIMTWDAESRMATAAGATYLYDAEGDRVEKQGLVVTDTIYFSGRPIARYSGGQWTDLIYGPNGLLAEVPGTQNGAPLYRATDNLGTIVGSLLANGSFVDPIDHTPFGQVFTGNTSDPYLFTGKERDSESGLDYFGARYYSSNMGRWMSPDWADKPEAVPYSSLDNPQTLNLYGYVNNNPLSRADADGHCAEDACIVEGSVALVAFGALTVSHYLQTPAGQRNLGDAASAAASIVSSAFHSVFSKADAPAAPAGEQPRTADGKFAPKTGAEAAPGAEAEAKGLGALGATKNNETINGTKRDGTITATGEHAEIKSGATISNTKQLAGMGAAAVAATGKPLVVGATNPNVTITKPAQQNPDLNIKKIPQ